MSAGYASRLSEYNNKGVCGLPETFDTKRSQKVKLNKFVQLVKESKHIVFLTGAGISTSAGIPDFRGPKGVWTLEEKQEKERRKRKKAKLVGDDEKYNPKLNNGDSEERQQESKDHQESPYRQDGSDFAKAKPTITHRAITKLMHDKADIFKYVVTQNVDGLHRRSGLRRNQLAVLHGCVFTEKCSICQTEYYRDFDVGGMSFQKTGRKCTSILSQENQQDIIDSNKDKQHTCGGDLCDTMLDWEDPLPEYDFDKATNECTKADLVIALGTSLRIEPAGSLPSYGKQFVIVNLQETPYDNQASLVMHCRSDDVMRYLMENLGYDTNTWINDDNLPPIERTSCVPSEEESNEDEAPIKVGTRFVKSFGKQGEFPGTVEEIPTGSFPFYKVKYDDGDKEDLTEKELKELLLKT